MSEQKTCKMFANKNEAKRYKKIKALNSGAFAQVDLAKDEISGVQVALKRIPKKSLENVEEKDHPATEVCIHRKLKHKSIIELKGSYETEEEYVLVMEYGGSMDLFELIHKQDHLEDEKCKEIFLQVLDAVEYCHSQGVYHRDIKPENVLLCEGRVKLCDFGLATMDPISRDFGYGSLSYMAPEVFGDYKAIDGYFSSSADVWALGILIFNMRLGILPWFEASRTDIYFDSFIKDPSSFKKNYNLSDEFTNLLKSCLELDPFKRCSLKKLRILFEAIKEFRKKDSPKRRLSFESLAIATQKIEKLNWAECVDEDSEDESKSVDAYENTHAPYRSFTQDSLSRHCGLIAHVKEMEHQSYMNILNVK